MYVDRLSLLRIVLYKQLFLIEFKLHTPTIMSYSNMRYILLKVIVQQSRYHQLSCFYFYLTIIFELCILIFELTIFYSMPYNRLNLSEYYLI